MKSSLEKIDSIRQCITVEAPAELVDKAIAEALEMIRKEASVPGFRKGKLPDSIILKRFGDELNTEAIKALAKETYPKAVAEVGAKPISEPQVEPSGKIEKGKSYSYKATFEVYPEVTATGYEGLKLEREKVHVTDDEVEAEVKRLQHQMTQLEPAPESELGPGMIGMIDFKGTADGKAFEGSEAENYVVDFGTGNLLEHFEVEIKGMKMSEERDVTFKYPDDYFKADVAGKKAQFRVKLKDVRRKIVPEIDDDFAKELGQFGSLGEVKKDLKKKIAEYKENLIKNQLREQAIRLLIEKHAELEVPVALIEAELGNMVEQLDRQLKAQGRSLAESKIDSKEFVRHNVKEATDRARGYMIVNAIAKQEKIEVAESEVEARIADIAAQNRQLVAKVKEHFETNKLIGQIHSQMVFEKTLDFVLGKAKVTELKAKKEK